MPTSATTPDKPASPDRAGSAELDHVTRSLELLWGRSAPPARGPKPGLTLDQVVDAAIKVADADGIEALSMRRVARELGVGTMSLYRYVPGKPELLSLMLDRFGGPDDVARRCQGQDWRTVLESNARCGRDLYLKHRWLLQVNWTRPVLGPNSVAGLEFLIGGLAGLGLSDQERITMVVTLDAYVTGAVRTETLYEQVASETGVSHEDFWGRQSPFLATAMETGDYPEMAALAEDAFGLGWDESFEWGLQRLLDGFEVLIAARQR